MASFKNVLIRNIKAKKHDRVYYEEVIAQWNLNGWLTDAEAEEVMVALNEVFPIEQ